jgi:hypothetical protein
MGVSSKSAICLLGWLAFSSQRASYPVERDWISLDFSLFFKNGQIFLAKSSCPTGKEWVL